MVLPILISVAVTPGVWAACARDNRTETAEASPTLTAVRRVIMICSPVVYPLPVDRNGIPAIATVIRCLPRGRLETAAGRRRNGHGCVRHAAGQASMNLEVRLLRVMRTGGVSRPPQDRFHLTGCRSNQNTIGAGAASAHAGLRN